MEEDLTILRRPTIMRHLDKDLLRKQFCTEKEGVQPKLHEGLKNLEKEEMEVEESKRGEVTCI